MDLAFTREEIAFRDEVRAFFKDNVPPATRQKMVEGRHLTKDEMVTWWRILNKKGWGVSHWPKEYGGTGWTSVQQYIFNEELQAHPAPAPLAFGVSMVGPVLYTFGNEAQKKQYLPRIANVDDWWCQGFSEPGSGSDLASLKTKAERKGDKYIINGQKTWTTLAQHADMIFNLCRTDASAKKQSGISFILMDMKSTRCFSTMSRFPLKTSSARRTKAGTMPSSCSAMSAPALPASASPRNGCVVFATSPPRSNPAAGR